MVQAYFGGAPVLSKLLDTIMGAGSFEKMMERFRAGRLDLVAELLKPHRASNWIQKMLKIIKGLIGEASDCKQLAFMVEECCHGVILSMTKDQLNQAPPGSEVPAEFYREMVKQNIRLYNRCAAFATGSSMVEGIEPPQDQGDH